MTQALAAEAVTGDETLLIDNPIKRSSEDLLDVTKFVNRLVRPLLEAPAISSIVVGLYGPWGHGKSSALNLLHEKLEEQTERVHSVVVRFNPWLYADAQTLIASFFATLGAQIGVGVGLSWTERRKLAGSLRVMGNFAGAAALHPALTIVAGLTKGVLGATAKLVGGGENDYRKERQKVETTLSSIARRGRPMRVVVLVDDLDRASASEVLTMLKLVRLVADLPNISYVLAMDDLRVRQLLDEEETLTSSFLEKIIQVVVHLPPISAERLRSLVIEDICRELKAAEIDASEFDLKRRWGGFDYDGTLGRRIRSLRDRTRYLNGLRFVLRTSQSKLYLNGEDIVLITFLQTFFPVTYDRVRAEKLFLTGSSDSMRGYIKDSDLQAALDARKERLCRIVSASLKASDEPESGEEIERVQLLTRIIRQLFPLAESGFRSERIDPRSLRVENRISSEERFDRYFVLAPPPDEASDDDVVRLQLELSTTVLQPEVSAGLVKPWTENEGLRASFIQKFRDHLNRIPRSLVDTVAANILGLEEFFGPQQVVLLTEDLARQLLTPEFGDEAGLVEPDPAPAERILLNVVERLDNPLVAVEAAYSFGDRNPASRQWTARFARAGVIRARVYAADHANLYSAISTFDVSRFLDTWMHLAARSGEPGDGPQSYLQALLISDPSVVSNVLTLVTAWGDRPNFSRRKKSSEILAELDRFIDRAVLIKAARIMEGSDKTQFPHLITAYLTHVRSSEANPSTQDESTTSIGDEA